MKYNFYLVLTPAFVFDNKYYSVKTSVVNDLKFIHNKIIYNIEIKNDKEFRVRHVVDKEVTSILIKNSRIKKINKIYGI